MRLNSDDIRRGYLDDQLVWICDFRINDIHKKPIRHVRPEKVMITPSKKTNRIIYHSKSYFARIKKNGKPGADIILLYDNTGFRTYRGVPLKVFTTEKECRYCYDEQAKLIIAKKQRYI